MVAQTATKAEIGTASLISKLKKISIIGILDPAPESPPAFEREIKINMRIVPIVSETGLVNGTFWIFSAPSGGDASSLTGVVSDSISAVSSAVSGGVTSGSISGAVSTATSS